MKARLKWCLKEATDNVEWLVACGSFKRSRRARRVQQLLARLAKQEGLK
jgi:cell division protein FtsN